jgi:hypothetical protein
MVRGSAFPTTAPLFGAGLRSGRGSEFHDPGEEQIASDADQDEIAEQHQRPIGLPISEPIARSH